MKNVFLCLMLVSGIASANSEIKGSVGALNSLKYDGQTLSFGYSISGGCQKHAPEVKVSLKEVSKYDVVAEVTVLDVTPAPDHCEAMLYIEGSADLGKLISEACKESSIENCQYTSKRLLLPALIFHPN